MAVQKKRKHRGKRNGSGKKTVFIVFGGIAVFLIAVYIGTSVYFMNHFLPNTEINGHSCAGKSASEVEETFKSEISEYVLTINDKDGQKEKIPGKDIQLEYSGSKDLENVMEEQSGFSWPKAVFSKEAADVTVDLSYDEEKLEQMALSLDVMTAKQIPSKSARPKFDGEQFVVQPEVYGTAIDKELFIEKTKEAVMQLKPELDLKKAGCYEIPKYTSGSEEVAQACEKMNKYCEASVTYSMDEPVVIDKTVISKWLKTDDDMKVTFKKKAVKKWLEEFGDQYDTVGTTRSFTTPTGKSASVNGGTYGWSINEDAEYETIVKAVENGETITKEPEYYIGGTAASHGMPDWGGTFAEVDLSEQHMWYVSNGEVKLETDVVTGEPIPEKITPEGTYTILEKSTNEVLVGDINPSTGKPSYRQEVSYWMRVTWEGIGFHDAIWQSAFGGSLNQVEGIGSHGCINMPLDKAAALYEMIEEGTPVIIHY